MSTATTTRFGRFADRLRDIGPSPIRAIFDKAAALDAAGEKVYHFEIGRPDFDTPQVVKDAAAASLDRGEVHYGPNAGTLDLREAISAYLQERRGTTYDPGTEVLITIGANEAVFLALMAFCGPGDEVIFPVPAWAHYESCIRLAGATPVPVRLDATDDYRLDIDAIAAAITPATRMVILCTPNNPTGGVATAEDIEKLATVLEPTDALLMSDEIYADLVYDEIQHQSPAAVGNLRERTLVVGGFAKAFAMDGWRLGWLAGPKELITPALRVRQYTTVCAPTFLQPGAAAALRHAGPDAESMRAEFQERRKAGLKILTGIPGVTVSQPDGAFYFYLTYTPETAEPAEQLALRLLDEQRVAVVPGTAFDPDGGTHSIRISYACHIDDLTEGLRRIVQTLTTPHPKGA
ncbi:pyridoxal phosphate-dependent aminotransferase [Paenarthrobacter nicotinovorans]|uniref:pyridoxal phosphate-dependent aminotransferase n=1 Tax=Paenarthrobacter nicotinovorans TaxID=29320 RepID=UPI0006F7F418|nr:pyridoxal phosphate-dependent aminotransferase [Paenarthrobacter nicotinovorans]KQQ99282.1 aspartate aminotransferase [Arthrobacter sp. Leaf145]MBP2392835.1 aspartate/methionine/tyrosine aminotransferase [Paenarthrobacter nicotinovorans]UKF00868.1 pyridoxal phosphate-dependent aminotransferase [Paenarthrobacter nicotinovorans]UKF05651.1 pyridoxal phosphate-dependent aminotransferase [Paenarthrobacter nicotinovorans]GGV28575.1 aminotransferase [Paenarthrobacter nicotinovorans]